MLQGKTDPIAQTAQIAQSVSTHEVVERLLNRLPSEVRATFTPSQIGALHQALLARPLTHHPINFRLTLPIFGNGVYIALMAGRNRRSKIRTRSQGVIAWAMFLASITLGCGSVFGIMALRKVYLMPAYQQPITQDAGFHPTALPFKETKAECIHSGRTWKNNQCIDAEHDPIF